MINEIIMEPLFIAEFATFGHTHHFNSRRGEQREILVGESIEEDFRSMFLLVVTMGF